MQCLSSKRSIKQTPAIPGLSMRAAQASDALHQGSTCNVQGSTSYTHTLHALLLPMRRQAQSWQQLQTRQLLHTSSKHRNSLTADVTEALLLPAAAKSKPAVTISCSADARRNSSLLLALPAAAAAAATSQQAGMQHTATVQPK